MPFSIQNILKSQWKILGILIVAALNVLLIIIFTNGGPPETAESLKENGDNSKLVFHKKLKPLELNRFRTTQLYPPPRRKKVPEVRKKKGPKNVPLNSKHKAKEALLNKHAKTHTAKRNVTNLQGPIEAELEPFNFNRNANVSSNSAGYNLGDDGAI